MTSDVFATLFSQLANGAMTTEEFMGAVETHVEERVVPLGAAGRPSR